MVADPQGERQADLALRPERSLDSLDHRVELQHALERGVELRERPVPGLLDSFWARNGWPPIALTMSGGDPWWAAWSAAISSSRMRR